MGGWISHLIIYSAFLGCCLLLQRKEMGRDYIPYRNAEASFFFFLSYFFHLALINYLQR